MKNKATENKCWEVCNDCKGQGKRKRRIRKKVRLNYKKQLAAALKGEAPTPIPPKAHKYLCATCKGSGLIKAPYFPQPDSINFPHIAIIGGGIGGAALAVACLHRGIPFTLYERDSSFNARSQGYALTLQQASSAIKGLGLNDLKEGVISTRHVVHGTDGEIIGEWGMRKWLESQSAPFSKRTNIHIARQSLRQELLDQLLRSDSVKWDHQLLSYSETESINLNFIHDNELVSAKADVLVGADGIFSTVRNLLLKDDYKPLRYLDCIVILGICPLSKLKDIENPLLDSVTVFQTANGNERIYMMPYDKDHIMWQLSFPLPEHEAKSLSALGSDALKKEACRRTQWHSPIPEILAATSSDLISGYPVYDREILETKDFIHASKTTLIGDAAHPMSPFKGQGANQALLDALALAREIYKGSGPNSGWREEGVRKRILLNFESEMLKRSAKKVKDSAEAAVFLHTDEVLYKANQPRGRHLKTDKNSN
ncbi:FAD-dependent monooxygenase [Leeuwenhoekiella aequorea]|uniref:FAD-dependent oxidoreductase n=1 Tax=Leeuwenhoekiella aequorea TaxID=283736 RepID=UPI00352FA4AE